MLRGFPVDLADPTGPDRPTSTDLGPQGGRGAAPDRNGDALPKASWGGFVGGAPTEMAFSFFPFFFFSCDALPKAGRGGLGHDEGGAIAPPDRNN